MRKVFFKVMPCGPIDTNAVLLVDPNTGKAAIIDTPPGSAEFLLETIQSLSVTVEKILFTHSHWDHIADAAHLKETLKVPLYMHQLDIGNLKKPGSDKMVLFFDIPAAEPDHLIEEGQSIQVGQLDLRVIHTPGHTPGGVCFYVEKEGERVLFSGDTLFKDSMGNINFPTASPKDMWQSLKKLSTLPADTRVIPGHGLETTIGAEKWIANAQERFLMYT